MSKRYLLGVALLVGSALGFADQAAPVPAPLATAVVQSAGGSQAASYDAVVEAVRQTVIASQVPGAVTAVDVKAGDTVKKGQVLLRIDARAAEQSLTASEAQVRSAQALLDVASKDFERQQQLFQKQYISQAALERAESQFKATQAQTAAMLAQAGGARTQSGFYVVRAPYAGIVSELPVALGDMALPGRALLTMYEPGALRVSAAVPQSAVAMNGAGQGTRVEFPNLPAERRWITAPQVQVLPTIDAATHTVTLRIPLPATTQGVAPGAFARVWLPGGADTAPRLYVPVSAVVRRAEMTGVYVVDGKGAAGLRQVRLGRVAGDTVEALSGLSAGESVATDPQAAARSR